MFNAVSIAAGVGSEGELLFAGIGSRCEEPRGGDSEEERGGRTGGEEAWRAGAEVGLVRGGEERVGVTGGGCGRRMRTGEEGAGGRTAVAG